MKHNGAGYDRGPLRLDTRERPTGAKNGAQRILPIHVACAFTSLSNVLAIVAVELHLAKPSLEREALRQ